MTGWPLVHLGVLCAWAGLVLAELIVETAGLRLPRLRYAAAKLHALLDTYVEIPLLVAVVATGVILIFRTPMDALLWLMVGLGLGAVGANVACALVVFRRARVAERDPESAALVRLTRGVFRTAMVGIPLAAGALLIGGTKVGWW